MHEAFLKLIDQSQVDWRSQSHFFAVGAQAMRRILVNHAKGRNRIKRGGKLHRLPLDEAFTISLDEAMMCSLSTRLSKSWKQSTSVKPNRRASVLRRAQRRRDGRSAGLSKRTVEREWTACRAWLRRELVSQEEP